MSRSTTPTKKRTKAKRGGTKDAPPRRKPVAEKNGAAKNGATKNRADSGSNGHAGKGTKKKRRATAESMAAGQRDISVSEFFAKNRHLLGFDNPRKALLTTVKEAVDNSLDACEEAGLLPEIWVHITSAGPNRFAVAVQDNGPGILRKQIPLIFGKLLYGSKFHRLRMSRGQQGIGISAAGMYGVLTTGKPVRIVSKVSKRKPAYYYEIQMDTKKNKPEILNGQGHGVEIPNGDKLQESLAKHNVQWEPVDHGTRVTIELEARYQRGRGSVDEYLQQTAIANPHVTLHYVDADGNTADYERSTEVLPEEPKEIKPHPYGVELGNLATMLKDSKGETLSGFLTGRFSRVSSSVARKICQAAKLSTRARATRIGRHEVDALYHAIQETKITAPTTDCLSPIGEDLLLSGLRHVVPGEFYAAATRPPSVYRGNPFQIEVALAYGGTSPIEKITLEGLKEMLAETDSRTIRQFLINGFSGIGTDGAERIIKQSKLGTRKTPGKLKPKEVLALHDAMKNVNLDEGQSMNVLRYANRVPLQFQQGACAITQAVTSTNWRGYGLSQSRGQLPSGPVTVMVHMASVWVPFTSESKEAVAGYPEIQKELRLALQSVGRKLGMYLRRRLHVKQAGDRRTAFLRYLGEVARAVQKINATDAESLYDRLVAVAKKKTSEADIRMDDRGQKVSEEDFGGGVIIVENETVENEIEDLASGEEE